MGDAGVVSDRNTVVAPVRLHISEVFLSLQGEGPSAGEPAVFLRLAACNLSCSWCDTPYTWDWQRFRRSVEVRTVSVTDIAEKIQAIVGPARLLVVTGGEPLLQQSALCALLRQLDSELPHVRVEVETNGTVTPTQELARLVHMFVAGLKLANSGIPESRRLRPEPIRALCAQNAAFKFVLTSPDQVGEVQRIAAENTLDAERIWLMPEGTSAEAVSAGMAALADACIASGYKLSPRLHILMWGDERGR